MLFNSGNGNILIGLALICLVWLIGLSIALYKNTRHYQNLIKIGDKKNLQEILEIILKKQEADEAEIKNLGNKLENLRENAKFHLQKIGFVRFNPFNDTGGNQSFIIALLDENNHGIIISSFHSRSGPRWYVKEIEKGKGKEINLSKEEEEAIKNAQG